MKDRLTQTVYIINNNKTMVIFILPLRTVIIKLKSSFSAMFTFHGSCKKLFSSERQRQTSHLLHSMLMYVLLQCPFFVLTEKNV